jgi:hypothetical protein
MSYFNLDIEESFSGEWSAYLGDVDPKYHLSLTRAMSNLHNWYGDKAHRQTDEWFTILYGMILELEGVLECDREHDTTPLAINIDDLTVRPHYKEFIDD